MQKAQHNIDSGKLRKRVDGRKEMENIIWTTKHCSTLLDRKK